MEMGPQPDIEPGGGEKQEDNKPPSLMAIYSKFENISQAEIDKFSESLQPAQKNYFETKIFKNNQKIIVWLSTLSEEEIQLLMQMAPHDLIGHNIVGHLYTLHRLTEDARYMRILEPDNPTSTSIANTG